MKQPKLVLSPLLLGLFFVISACNLNSVANNDSPGTTISLSSADNGRTISGLNFSAQGRDYGFKIDGAADIIIENCTIADAVEANILIRGSSRITIRNCTLVGGQKSGIRISAAAASDQITIDGNNISGARHDGIIVAVDEAQNIRHDQVLIRNNTISNVASDLSWPGHYHGMYIQTPGYQISDNRVVDVHDGNGISVRAGGTISNNLVMRTGKNGISYYADHHSATASALTITDNTVWAVGQNSALSGGAPIAILELPSPALADVQPITSATLTDNQLGPFSAGNPLVVTPQSPNYLSAGIVQTGTTTLVTEPNP